MKSIWLDAQLPPVLAKWIFEEFKIPCRAVRDLGLRDAPDLQIFKKAKEADVVVIIKDKDFVELLHKFGPPPKILWLTCGNTSRDEMKKILSAQLAKAMAILLAGNELVEIQ